MAIWISTHAPRTGSDDFAGTDFLRRFDISTHAPRTGSDHGTPRPMRAGSDFNPRSPHGERPSAR